MLTARTIAEELQGVKASDITHPALRRLRERMDEEKAAGSLVLGIYSRMHHRHNKSLPKPPDADRDSSI